VPRRELAPFTDDGLVNAIIETPAGHRNKYKWEPALDRFTLSRTLPAGAVFPFDFGFIPGTKAGDGDPLDVLVLMDEGAFTGCHLRIRLLGVIRATQTDEDGKSESNPRLIGVAEGSRDRGELQAISDLDPAVLDQIEHFFASYHALDGGSWDAEGRDGPDAAQRLVREATEKG
jgi:inorganic pyrophosphatase